MKVEGIEQVVQVNLIIRRNKSIFAKVEFNHI